MSLARSVKMHPPRNQHGIPCNPLQEEQLVFPVGHILGFHASVGEGNTAMESHSQNQPYLELMALDAILWLAATWIEALRETLYWHAGHKKPKGLKRRNHHKK